MSQVLGLIQASEINGFWEFRGEFAFSWRGFQPLFMGLVAERVCFSPLDEEVARVVPVPYR
jgi:hypothetical protein